MRHGYGSRTAWLVSAILTVLPLAFVMIAGPQIISAVFLATSVDWARNSLAYLAGAALSITVAVTAAYLAVKGAKDLAGSSSEDSEGRTIDGVLLALLVFAAVNVYRKRKVAHPPKWMGRLQEATGGFAFKLGFLLLGVFPTDIVTSITVGAKVAREGDPWWYTLGFVALTLLLLAIPAILVLLLGKRAKVLLPKVRDWMNANSWVISELVILLFIGITINSLAGS
jgi:hypothetical protein